MAQIKFCNEQSCKNDRWYSQTDQSVSLIVGGGPTRVNATDKWRLWVWPGEPLVLMVDCRTVVVVGAAFSEWRPWLP